MPSIASPRAATVTALHERFDQVPAPADIQRDDLLVAVVTSSVSLDDIDIQGGDAWVPQGEDSSNGFNTRWFTQVAGEDNPTTYSTDLGPTFTPLNAAICAILVVRGGTPAGMLLVADSGGPSTPVQGAVCPDAEPGVAGGVEIRYAVTQEVTWNLPGGYTVAGQAGHSSNMAAAIAAKTTLTSADLEAQAITWSSSVVAVWQAWTLIVVPGEFVPPPPEVPSFASKGRALFRYTAHDLLTGDYIDDVYPRDVSYDKRINEPGAFSGRIPIPNARVAQAVSRIIPRTKADLSTGPGRVEIRIWRDGVLQPRYWLTAARVSRGRDGKITVELRGSTLDAFFYSIRVRDTRSYAGDQVANVRQLLQHAQTQAGANLGLQFQGGTSGVSRPLTATKAQGTTYGRAAQEYVRTSGGFETTINDFVGNDGVESEWVWGYPTLGSGTRHVVTESRHGGDIAEWSIDIDALRGGTDFEVRGGTPEGDATAERVPLYSAMVTTPHRAAGWPRVDRLVDHPTQSTDGTTLDMYAQYVAERAGGALWVRTVTVFLPKTSTLTMNSLGDYCRQVMSNVWFERVDGGAGLDISERIIGIEVRPPEKGRGREEARLVLESEALT